MLVVIAVCAFLAVVCTVFAFAQRPAAPLQARIEALAGGPSMPGGTAVTGQPLLRTTRLALGTMQRGSLSRCYESVERMQVAAGMAPNAGRFLLLWAIVAAGALILGTAAFGLLGLALGLFVSLLPYLWLRRRVRSRRQRIARSLPDAIDLLVACVEAGLGIDAALVRVSEATDGPLAEEIRLTTGEIAIGRPRQEALLDLGARTGAPDLLAFLRPIVQAERAGTGIGTALRVQAAAMRERRRQRAREKAEKVPAKMTIPMAVFFLPALMIVVAVPAFLMIQRVFTAL